MLDAENKNRGAGIVKDFNDSIEAMQESDLKQLLRTMSFGVNDYAELRKNIMLWFNDYMSAATTWYKRSMTRKLFVLGLITSIVFNVNAISLVQDLYKDKLLRERVVEAAIR
ncbi:MAG: hypothetical protein Fur0041_14500 [Bacteroidia bacterium]